MSTNASGRRNPRSGVSRGVGAPALGARGAEDAAGDAPRAFPCLRSSGHLPLFVRMSPRRADWSHAGLKGLVPSVLHYSLLGYNFFIPDAVGNRFGFGFFSPPRFRLFCRGFSSSRSGRSSAGGVFVLGVFNEALGSRYPVFHHAALIGLNVTGEWTGELKTQRVVYSKRQPGLWGRPSQAPPLQVGGSPPDLVAFLQLNPTQQSAAGAPARDLPAQARGRDVDAPETPAAPLQVGVSAPKHNGLRNPHVKTL